MADISDVRNTLGSLAGAAMYPNGVQQMSVAGVTVVVRSGWPVPQQLKAIMAAGNAMISIYGMPGMGKNTNRFIADDDAQATVPAPQLTLAVAGNRVTVGGAINPGEAPTLRVNYQPYSHSVLSTDTIDTVAAALAALIPGASAAGAVITINGLFDLESAISVPVTVQQEIGRQAQVFMVVIWTPSEMLRDAVGRPLELAFKQQPRIVMPDNTWARMLFRGVTDLDGSEKQQIYRRNLLYEVEYALTEAVTTNTVTNFGVTVTPTSGTPRTINI
ncbi:MAG: hypothetical protein WCA85_25745 [Paraburkholderia sp.]|uniref:hypothetical protein n=1 Tax=Paraburkholderia sp. TaxID=1926495 RepID=UPI003C565690